MKTLLLAGAAGGALLIAAGAAAPAMAQDTTVSGRVYYDLTNVDQTSDGAKQAAPSGNAFDIKRFYVQIDHRFNDQWSADLTTDAQYNSTLGATELFIKKAYVQGKFSDAFTVRVGSADTPWIPYAEDIYGFRYVEKTITDGLNQGTSADWGVHVLGKFGNSLSYQISAVNGQGYKVAPGTGSAPRPDAIDVEGRVSWQQNGFNLAIGGYSGKLGKDAVGVTSYNTATRFNALAAYVKGPVRVGVEYFKTNDWNATVSGVSTTYITENTYDGSADGTSVFGSYQFTPNFNIFARWDQAKFDDHNPAIAANLQNPKENYYLVGVSYSPYKNVDFSLGYKNTKVDHGTLALVDGTVGATNGADEGKRTEIGLWGQFRW